MITFNTDNMVAQEFPFPAPIMDYIFKNITAAQLLKLYKTCKFFYDKFRLNIIEDFEIRQCNTCERIVGNSLAIWEHNPSGLQLNNLWISNSFTVIGSEEKLNLDYTKFSRLTFDKLYYTGEAFAIEDYESLVKCPSLRHLIINGKVYNSEKDMYLTCEEIIKLAPHVSTFDLRFYTEADVHEEPIDMNKLIAMNRQTKITSLYLHSLYAIPDPLLVIEFFKKHAVPDVDYYFEAYDHDDPDNMERFCKTIDAGLRVWKLSLQLPPTISSTSFIDLTGKLALITGASAGIGKAATILFRQLGASVIAIARDHFRLRKLSEECQKTKSDGFIHATTNDPCGIAYIEEIFEIMNNRFGWKFDILVVNVDRSRWLRVPNAKLEEKHHDYFYALKGRFKLLQAAAPRLIDAKGTIINISSYDDLIAKPEEDAMIANLEQRIENVEAKLGSSGVRINTVDPGDSVSALPRPEGITDFEYKKLLEKSKKTFDEQAANAIAFLASDAAKLIDEAVLPVNALNLC